MQVPPGLALPSIVAPTLQSTIPAWQVGFCATLQGPTNYCTPKCGIRIRQCSGHAAKANRGAPPLQCPHCQADAGLGAALPPVSVAGASQRQQAGSLEVTREGTRSPCHSARGRLREAGPAQPLGAAPPAVGFWTCPAPQPTPQLPAASTRVPVRHHPCGLLCHRGFKRQPRLHAPLSPAFDVRWWPRKHFAPSRAPKAVAATATGKAGLGVTGGSGPQESDPGTRRRQGENPAPVQSRGAGCRDPGRACALARSPRRPSRGTRAGVCTNRRSLPCGAPRVSGKWRLPERPPFPGLPS